MQLGDPSVLESSSGKAVMAVAAAAEAPQEDINGDGGDRVAMDTEENKGRGDEGDKINCGGNRWPRQETLALLKIRSEMDAVFRDSSLKGPLWEEVSRKLADLGYQRSAKKCKEKFENVYKYHKRTKESRSGKSSEGKTYRFFDQLQALENQFTVSQPPKPQPSLATNTLPLPTRPSDTATTISYVATVPSSTNPIVISPSPPVNNATITSATTAATTPRIPSSQGIVPFSLPNISVFSTTTSTSSSTASDEDLEERHRKKRKWKDYFRRLTRQVLAKQEEMQKRFLEAIDKRERERVAQQEAWRLQEMARINREHELLVQERSTAAAKDATVIAFLQKLSGQQNPTLAGVNFLQHLTPPPPPQPLVTQVVLQPQPQPQPLQQQQQTQPPPHPPALLMPNNNFEIQKLNNGHPPTPSSSSRWPKAEVHALISLRTRLDAKYQENGPKAPLWEEISAGMKSLGYNRSAKRCKEKWENINKYFKKVKESNKQRREDSKTCPYFRELDALYKEKNKTQNAFDASFHNMKPNEMMEPLMVRPEQQWRPPPQYDHEKQQQQQPLENESHYQEKEMREGEEDEEEEEDDVVEEDGDSVEDDHQEGAGRYEIATNKLSSVDIVE